MSKHTPEPWRVSGESVNTINIFKIVTDNKIISQHAAYEFYNCSIDETNSNAARIVACINACAGMEDPAAEIERLRAERESLIEALYWFTTLAPDSYKPISNLIKEARKVMEQVKGDQP